jgi:hypothetical protein
LQKLALQSGLDLNVERRMPRPLRAKKLLGINLDAAVYAFETSTIDLCLSLHPGTVSLHQGSHQIAGHF